MASTDTPPTTAAVTAEQPLASRRPSRIAALTLLLAGGVLWLASRLTWVTVTAFDDKAGSMTRSIVGATWSNELTAVALLFAAAAVAGLFLRRTGRRVVGALAAIAGFLLLIVPGSLVINGADPQRAHNLLVAGLTSQHAHDPELLAQWAEIAGVDVHATGVALSVLAALIAVVGGIILAVRPGGDSAKLDRYEKKSTRLAKVRDNLNDEPDSERVMWDALDADIDPTDSATGGAANRGD